MDPYRTLGISRDCTLDDVKEAFRASAMHTHPDRGGEELAFIRLSAAYKQILRELELRSKTTHFTRKPQQPGTHRPSASPPIANWAQDPKDPYRTLGVSRDCTLAELKKAFQELTMQAHPDLAGEELAFVILSSAYKQILRELELRSQSTHFTRKPQTSDTPRPSANPPIANWSPDLVVLPVPADPRWQPELVLNEIVPVGARDRRPAESHMSRQTYKDLLRKVSAQSSDSYTHPILRGLRAIVVVLILYIVIALLLAWPFALFTGFLEEETRRSGTYTPTAGFVYMIVAILAPLLPATWIFKTYAPHDIPQRRRRRRRRLG